MDTVLVLVEESEIGLVTTDVVDEVFVVDTLMVEEAEVCRMVSARTTGRHSGMQGN